MGLVLMGGDILSKYLIQFSDDGWICVPTQEADPDLPVSLQEFPAEAWVGVGWWWPAAGSGVVSLAVPAWDLLKEVAIIFITSTIVWPQVKQPGGNTAPSINRKLD